MSKPIFALAHKAKSESFVTKSDALRMKLYMAAYVRSNRDKDGISSAEMSKNIWCTLEHLFDNHDLCSPTFCWKLKEKLKHQNYKEKTGNNLTNMQTDPTRTNVPIDADNDLEFSEDEVSTKMETTKKDLSTYFGLDFVQYRGWNTAFAEYTKTLLKDESLGWKKNMKG